MVAILKRINFTIFAKDVLQAIFFGKSMKKIYRKLLVSENPDVGNGGEGGGVGKVLDYILFYEIECMWYPRKNVWIWLDQYIYQLLPFL